MRGIRIHREKPEGVLEAVSAPALGRGGKSQKGSRGVFQETLEEASAGQLAKGAIRAAAVPQGKQTLSKGPQSSWDKTIAANAIS